MNTEFSSYSITAFISVLILASVHFFACGLLKIPPSYRGKFLSFGGGIAIAYVFIELLPKLCLADQIIRTSFTGVLPFAERHVYILALLGFLLFFSLDGKKGEVSIKKPSYISLAAYTFFNFFLGYAIAYKNDPDIQPLALFTFAMALHCLTNDYTLNQESKHFYQKFGKKIIVASLFLGFATGSYLIISKAAIALINAFLGGGVIMNVTRHELPSDNPNSKTTFLIGAGFYTLILLTFGR